MAAVGGQPGLFHVAIHIGVAQLPVGAAAVEALAGGPAGIDQGKVAQAPLGQRIEAAAIPGRIVGEGLAQAEQKQAVVGGGAGRAANTTNPLGALGLQHRPVVRLLRPHRPAVDQRRPLHAK